MSSCTPRARTGLVTVCLLFLLFAAFATQARADGEEDPAFANQGTAWTSLPGPEELSETLVDQAPDGTVVSAVNVQSGGVTRGDPSGPNRMIQVMRHTAAGVPTGLDGDGVVFVPADPDHAIAAKRMLDVEVLASGAIVLVYSSVTEDNGRLHVVTLDATGAQIDRDTYTDTNACDSSGEATAAQVATDARVFAVWNDCDDTPTLMRYTDGGEASETLPHGQRADHLVLGPDGSVYILIDLPELDTRGAGGFSQVLRYTTGLDPFDGFAGEELSGEPLALGVDGAGRAAVWTQNGSEPGSPARGGGNRWDIWRLTAQGVIDTSWSDDGLARIEHPEIGDPEPPAICSKCPPSPPFARLLSLPDGRVIALGYAAEEAEARLFFFGSQRRAIARLTDAGDLDPAWDGDGVKLLVLEEHEEGRSFLSSMSSRRVRTTARSWSGPSPPCSPRWPRTGSRPVPRASPRA